jgi:tetratricopeptide (TPR) repeat protein
MVCPDQGSQGSNPRYRETALSTFFYLIRKINPIRHFNLIRFKEPQYTIRGKLIPDNNQKVSLWPPIFKIPMVTTGMNHNSDYLNNIFYFMRDRADQFIHEGNIFAGLDQCTEAVDSYDKAIALNPVNVVAWNNRGVVLDNLDRSSDAVASYDKAVLINPEYAEAWNSGSCA